MVTDTTDIQRKRLRHRVLGVAFLAIPLAAVLAGALTRRTIILEDSSLLLWSFMAAWAAAAVLFVISLRSLGIAGALDKWGLVAGPTTPGRVPMDTVHMDTAHSLDDMVSAIFYLVDCRVLPGSVVDMKNRELVLDESCPAREPNETAQLTHLRVIRMRTRLPMVVFCAVLICYALMLPMLQLQTYLIALGGAALVSLLAYRLLPRPAVVVEEVRVEESADTVEGFLSTVPRQIQMLENLSNSIASETMREAVVTMHKLATEIYTFCENNPDKIPSTRQFTVHYLPLTMKMLVDYQTMEGYSEKSGEILQSLASIEEMTSTIIAAFKSELENLQFGKALDVSTDIVVLKGMMNRNLPNQFKVD